MKKRIIVFLLVISCPLMAMAQWGNFGGPVSSYTSLINPPGPFFGQMLSTGAGDFATYPLAATNARLHITDLTIPLPANGSFTAGQLFRTDGFFAQNNSWRMFTGPDVLGLTERFNLTVPPNTSDLRIETTQPGSTMFFRNGPGIDVMQINSTFGPGDGNVWIRKGVTHPFYQPSFLDIGGPIGFSAASLPANENSLIYHNTSSQGPCVDPNRDGFRMLYDFNADGINNADCLVIEKTDGQTAQPDGCIEFTNYGSDNIRRLSMTIDGTGHVGCGAGYTFNRVPWRRLSVAHATDPQLRLHTNHEINMNDEIYTDFQTMPNGDLQIDPRSTLNTLRTVFINYGGGTGLPTTTFGGVGLDINGQENIRTVNQDDNLNQVLVWEPGTGNVRWRNANTITPGGGGGIVTADNGLHMQTSTEVHLGGTLLYHTVIEQNGFILDLRNSGTQRQIFYPNGAVYQNTDNTASYAHRMDVASDEGLLIIQNGGGTSVRSIQTVYDQLNSSASFVGERLGTTSYGFRSLIHSANVNYGLHAVVQGTLASDNTAVFAAAANAGNSNTGVYCSAPFGTGNNAIIINGEGLQVAGGNNFSDSIIKTNVQPLTNATQIIEQLQPKTFEFRYNDFPSINFDHDSHFGVIAQDVEDVLPTLVGSGTIPAVLDSNNNVIHPAQTIKTVVYEEFIPILIAGFNEQQQRINQQDSTIAAMQQQMNDMMAMITNCCAQGNNIQAPNTNNPQTFNYQANVHQRDVRLTDTYCVLGENSPNPFRDHTVINYELAETSQSAQIVFYNMVGQIIKVIEINERGQGRLNVYGEDLRSGMYSYSLIIDGNVCETKKMIKE